jgi:anaerobic selenocysteine-containing dehydrogenase
MIDEIESGNLRVLIVFGGNPINSFPNTNATQAAFKKLDALAVLDVVSTDTTEIATHIMPTKGQLERADIPFFVDQFNSDMSTQFTDAVVEPTPDMRSMWWITEQIAISCGTSILPTTLSSESSDKDVLAHIAHRSAVDFDQLQSERYMTVARPFGWVVNKLLPEGKWRICPEQISDQLINYPTSTATSNPQYPFRLISQRQPKHLNSQHMLPLDAPNMDKPGLLIHSETATNLQLAEGDSVLISSPVGSLQAKIIYQNTLRPECVVFPHGWNTPSVSHLTSYKEVDPLTGMVIQTSIPVSLTKVSC